MALTAVAAGALLLRCVSIAEPLGIDQSLWASAVRGMSRGQLLYRDVWEQRPPGIYLLYLAAFRTLGWTASTVAWLDVLAAAATALLLYRLATVLSGPGTGAAAAALYAALTMPAWLYSHGGFLERSVCETFIVVCVGLAFWCAVRYRERASLAVALCFGLLVGAAAVLKPNAALYFPAVFLWAVLYQRERASRSPQFLIRVAVAGAIGAAVVPLATLAWLWHLGLLEEARIAVVDFNRFYVAQGMTVGGYALTFSKAIWLRIKTDPLWLAGAVGAAVALAELWRSRRLPPLAGLAVLWGGAAALAIVVNGARLFNSYFIQALAPLALLSAWLLAGPFPASRGRRLLALATALVMAVLLVQRGYPGRVGGWALADFERLLGRSERTAYLERFGGYDNRRGYSARANAELASYVREHTDQDERVFLFGINGAGVYFAADRLAAHRFLRVNFFVSTDFPNERFRLEAVLDELGRARPRYLIFERLHSSSEMARTADALPDHPAVIALLADYRLEGRIEDFTLYRRLD